MAEAPEPNSVANLAFEARIREEDLDQSCSECDLCDLAYLCDPWELIGHHLGLREADISAIKENYDRAELRRFQMLKTWRETKLRPTYKLLIEAFLKCGKVQQALTICEKVKQVGSPSSAAAPPPPPAAPAAAELAVQCRINKSLRRLDLMFSVVQRQVMKVVSLNELKSCVATLNSFKSQNSTRLFSSRNMHEFFHNLKDYCSVLSHNILEDLITLLEDDETKRKMNDFKAEYEAFQRATMLKDFVGNYEGPKTAPPDYKELEIKLGDNWHEKTLEDLENLRCQISRKAWLFKTVEEGCLVVKYFVPDDESLPLETSGGYLCDQSVLYIEIDDKIYLFERNTITNNPVTAVNTLPQSALFKSKTALPGNVSPYVVLSPPQEKELDLTKSPKMSPMEATDTLLSEGGSIQQQQFLSSTSDRSDTDSASNKGTNKVIVDLDTFIKEVYVLLGNSWKFLARELGFSKTDIDALEHDNPYLMEDQMFYQWKRREGDGATSDKLLAAMKSAGFDEQIKILTGKGMIENEKSSADLASSLAAGVRLPIQASDDTQVQTDSPVRPKLTATNTPSLSSDDVRSDDVRSDGPFRSKTAPPGSASTSSPRDKELGTTRSSKTSPTASTPPSDRDFIRQQRLKRFSSSTSDKSDTNSASCSEQRVLDCPPREVAGSDTPLGGAAMRTSSATTEASSPSAGTFEVGDCIRVERPDSAPWYGVIRWIGTLPGTSTAPLAGMEMEHVVKGGGDGSIAGVRHFTCAEGHGLFLPLSRLKRDDRFDALDNAGEVESSESSPRVERSTNPVSDPFSDLMSRLLMAGENRGTEQSDASSDSEPGGSEEEPTTESSACVERSAETFDDRISGLMSTLCTGESTDHSSSLVFYIPGDQVGILVGKGGKNVQEVESETNTTIKVPRKRKGAKISENVKVTIIGSEENRKKALFLMLRRLKQRIENRIATAETMTIPNPKLAGQIIGKKGSNKHIIEQMTGAKIRIENPETGSLEKERKCVIHGTAEQIAEAKEYIKYAMDGVDIATVANMTVLVQELVGYFESIGFEFPNKFE